MAKLKLKVTGQVERRQLAPISPVGPDLDGRYFTGVSRQARGHCHYLPVLNKLLFLELIDFLDINLIGCQLFLLADTVIFLHNKDTFFLSFSFSEL